MTAMKKNDYSRTGYISFHTKQIDHLLNSGKITLALKIISELIKDYSTDEILLELLGRSYMLLGDYEEAAKAYENVKEDAMYFKKVLIYYKLHNEEQLKRLYEKYFKEIRETDREHIVTYNALRLYLMKIFEPEKIENEKPDLYILNQIIDYDREKAIEHVYERHVNEFEGKSKFASNLDIRELFDKFEVLIQENRDSSMITKSSEGYLFFYPCAGRFDESKINNLNYIYVGTLLDTNKIVTMCPVKQRGNMKVINTITPQYTEEKPKVKKLSRIEKFNEKYKNYKGD